MLLCVSCALVQCTCLGCCPCFLRVAALSLSCVFSRCREGYFALSTHAAWTGKAGSVRWTASFDTKQAPTLGPRLVRSLSHLPQVYVVGLSIPRVELVNNTGVETRLTALRQSGLVRKVPTDIAAKLWEMLGLSMRRKLGSEGFAANGIRLNKRCWELDQAPASSSTL